MPDNSFMEMKYLEQGQHPENSTTHDDSKFRSLVSKISKIKGWYNTIDNDYCLGIQATYDEDPTPPEFIGQMAKGKTKVLFSLARDEYVMGIKGRGGEIINTLTFVTSSGRELKIGSSETEGNPFKIQLPGHRIHTPWCMELVITSHLWGHILCPIPPPPNYLGVILKRRYRYIESRN